MNPTSPRPGEPPKTSSTSLRRVLFAAVAGLGALALAATAALVLLTTSIHRTTEVMASAMVGVRTAEGLEVELLTLHRLSRPILRDQQGVVDQLARSRARLQVHMEEALREAPTQEERSLLAEASEGLEAYLVTWARAMDAEPGAHTVELNARLEATLVPLDRLVTLNLVEAQQAQLQADRWNQVADLWGGGVVGLLLVGGAALSWWMRRSVFQPLLGISQAIRHFGRGHKLTRAPETGPAELREMAHTFNELADSLERQQAAQLTFLAGVAHDLRNPLSALKLSTAPTASPPSEERLLRTMGIVSRQVSRLDRMVGDLLDSTRIESGHLELNLEPRDARDLAASVVELYQMGGGGREPVLVLPETPVPVRCDPLRLEQVLHNLVSNALKYSPADSPVEVRVECEGEEAVLAVTDRGIGMSAEELRDLFMPFGRTGRARETAPGVGLGLSVARRIVEAHGGRIEVESEPGVGSTFRVRLPLPRARAAPDPEPSASLHPGGLE